jgi:hypothetical protein
MIAGGYQPSPSPSVFGLDLWNQRVAGGVWLQNIDFRYFVSKISEMRNLGALKGKSRSPSGMTKRTATTKAKARFPSNALSTGDGTMEKRQKAKGCAARSLVCLTLYFYCSELGGINRK